MTASKRRVRPQMTMDIHKQEQNRETRTLSFSYHMLEVVACVESSRYRTLYSIVVTSGKPRVLRIRPRSADTSLAIARGTVKPSGLTALAQSCVDIILQRVPELEQGSDGEDLGLLLASLQNSLWWRRHLGNSSSNMERRREHRLTRRRETFGTGNILCPSQS